MSEGLVKKLLFPGYADSGSNDAFRSRSSGGGVVPNSKNDGHSSMMRNSSRNVIYTNPPCRSGRGLMTSSSSIPMEKNNGFSTYSPTSSSTSSGVTPRPLYGRTNPPRSGGGGRRRHRVLTPPPAPPPPPPPPPPAPQSSPLKMISPASEKNNQVSMDDDDEKDVKLTTMNVSGVFSSSSSSSSSFVSSKIEKKKNHHNQQQQQATKTKVMNAVTPSPSSTTQTTATRSGVSLEAFVWKDSDNNKEEKKGKEHRDWRIESAMNEEDEEDSGEGHQFGTAMRNHHGFSASLYGGIIESDDDDDEIDGKEKERNSIPQFKSHLMTASSSSGKRKDHRNKISPATKGGLRTSSGDDDGGGSVSMIAPSSVTGSSVLGVEFLPDSEVGVVDDEQEKGGPSSASSSLHNLRNFSGRRESEKDTLSVTSVAGSVESDRMAEVGEVEKEKEVPEDKNQDVTTLEQEDGKPQDAEKSLSKHQSQGENGKEEEKENSDDEGDDNFLHGSPIANTSFRNKTSEKNDSMSSESVIELAMPALEDPYKLPTLPKKTKLFPTTKGVAGISSYDANETHNTFHTTGTATSPSSSQDNNDTLPDIDQHKRRRNSTGSSTLVASNKTMGASSRSLPFRRLGNDATSLQPQKSPRRSQLFSSLSSRSMPSTPAPTASPQKNKKFTTADAFVLITPSRYDVNDDDRRRTTFLSPRFSKSHSPTSFYNDAQRHRQQQYPSSSSMNHTHPPGIRTSMNGGATTTSSPSAAASMLLSPMRRARACFSPDAMGTTEGGINEGNSSPPPSPSMGHWRTNSTMIPKSPSARAILRSVSWDVGGGSGGCAAAPGGRGNSPIKIGGSTVLQNEFSGGGHERTKSGGSLDRPRSGGSGGDTSTGVEIASGVKKKGSFALHAPQRVAIEREDALDLLTCLVERSVAFHEQTDRPDPDNPGRGDTNRLSNNTPQDKFRTRDEDDNADPESTPQQQQQQQATTTKLSEPIALLREISRIYEEQSITCQKETLTNDNNNDTDGVEVLLPPDHAARMKAMDELLRSHTYALEMKRAALSAWTWLRAIGRSNPSDGHTTSTVGAGGGLMVADDEIIDTMDVASLRAMLRTTEQKLVDRDDRVHRLDQELAKCRAEIGRLKSSTRAEALFTSPNRSILDDDDSSSSELSSETKNDIAELENALADVTPVLENSADSGHFDLLSPPPPESKDKQSTTPLETSADLRMAAEAKKEVVLLKAALEEANNQIQDLHKKIKESDDSASGDEAGSTKENECSLSDSQEKEQGETVDQDNFHNVAEVGTLPQQQNDESLGDGHISTTALANTNPLEESKKVSNQPISEGFKPISILDASIEKELDDYMEATRKADRAEIESLKTQLAKQTPKKDPQAKNDSKATPDDSFINGDQRMINVRMLNGENFVTDWDDLAPPLPPPPDHGLRSPIVDALLSEWTSDLSMRESLLSWMDRILDGEDPDSVPSLKISSLDHQLRDGFSMHILPLLLRRPDIHVDVSTRAHRRTSYDISVSVTHSVPLHDGGVAFGEDSLDGSIKGSREAQVKAPIHSYHQVNGSHTSATSKHLMAFKASRGGQSVIDESHDDAQESPSNAWDSHEKERDNWIGLRKNLSSEVGATSVSNSAVTTPTSN